MRPTRCHRPTFLVTNGEAELASVNAETASGPLSLGSRVTPVELGVQAAAAELK